MNSVFTALGTVNTGRKIVGEANIWRPGTRRGLGQRPVVCIDTGLPGAGLFWDIADAEPEILILTHADDDHIGGFDDLIRLAAPPSELWVPYEWEVIRLALAQLRNPNRAGDGARPVTNTDIDWVVTAAAPDADRPTPAWLVAADDDRAPEPEVAPERGDQSDVTGDDDSSNEPVRPDPQPFPRLTREERDYIQHQVGEVVDQVRGDGNLTGTRERIAKEIADRGTKVASAIEEARSRGVRVRYFSVDHPRVRTGPAPYTWVGEPGSVTLVNAVEVKVEATRVASALAAFARLSALTTTNRRALVTFLWDDWPDPRCGGGVLVWSDSGGESCLATDSHDTLVPWDVVSLMTAPHHGSSNPGHARIWDEWVAERRPDQTLIPVIQCGGHQSQKRPARLFMAAHPRACTRCRHSPAEDYPKTVEASVFGLHVVVDQTCAP